MRGKEGSGKNWEFGEEKESGLVKDIREESESVTMGKRTSLLKSRVYFK